MMSKPQPVSMFISYAHEDEPLRKQLEKHLSLLQRQGLISTWQDRRITAGTRWAQEIDEHLKSASIILLLISADFLASDYCYGIEMRRALERHKAGQARVIPIFLRPVDWEQAPFTHLQGLPNDGKAVTTWQNQDEALLIIAQGLRRVIEQQQIPTLPLSQVGRQNRASLIKRVQTIWIEGLLEHSLYEAVRLELHLQERPDVLVNPWRLQVQELNRPPRPLPAGTSIVQVYDEAEGELLILGEPGAGKTTLLLELTRILLNRAEADEHHRIPVIFNLSSWVQERSPLSEWLVEELWTKYQIPSKIGQSWVAADQILLLLDGLDEVAEEARADCVQAINTYSQKRIEQGEQESAPLVVCCRIKEYMALSTRVTSRQAVNIQPLTDEQIEYYLQSAGNQLEVLRQALREDPELYELAHRPLMLSIFTLAYQGARLQDLPTQGTREVQQRQVFATYVERMLSRREAFRHFSREQALHWLTFLAMQMQQHHQTAFYLEYLQPNWLIKQLNPQLYQWIFRRGFRMYLEVDDQQPQSRLPRRMYSRRKWIEPGEVLTWSWREARSSAGLLGAVTGIKFGALFGGGVGVLVGVPALIYGFGSGLKEVLFGGLFGALVGGGGSGLAGDLLGGFSINQLKASLRRTPNQGIWRSAQNGLLFGLGSGLVGSLGFGLGFGLAIERVFGLASGLSSGLVGGLGFGLLTGMCIGYLGGLDAFLAHFILRFWLRRTGSLPWNLVAFLDEVADRLILRKVGGGYIFIHRLLLDHLAEQETTSIVHDISKEPE